MDVDFGFICDYADNSGKLTAVGIGIDAIFTQNVPATHPALHAVLRLRFSSVEVGEKTISLRLVNDDGEELLRIEGPIPVSAPPEGRTETTHTFNVALQNIEFPAYGNYAVIWVLGEQEVKRIPFTVAQPPQTN